MFPEQSPGSATFWVKFLFYLPLQDEPPVMSSFLFHLAQPLKHLLP